MLERKRRARINRCLDELKEFMVVALQAEGENNVSKLEKADILELTVRHLHKLRKQQAEDGQRYKAGFTRCAAEVSQYLGNAPESRVNILQHLATCLRSMEGEAATVAASGRAEGPSSPVPQQSSGQSCCQSQSTYIHDPVWRPW